MPVRDFRDRPNAAVKRRGQELFDRGAVTLRTADTASANCVVEGSAGTAYQVWLDKDEYDELTGRCTCPYDWEPVCKHMVACVLAWDHADAHSPVSLAPTQPTAVDIEAEAEQLNVADLLDVGGAIVSQAVGGYAEHWLRTQHERTVGQILLEPASNQRGGVPESVHLALRHFLKRESAARRSVSDALEERQALHVRPSDSAGDLWDRLQALRAALGEAPMVRIACREAGRLEIALDPPGLVWSRGHVWYARHRVVLELGGEHDPAAAACECVFAQCGAPLEAVDEALDLLGSPDRADESDPFVSAVGIPPWERALHALDSALSIGTEVAPLEMSGHVAELGWRVTLGYTLGIEPVLCRPMKRKGGWTTKRLARANLFGLPLEQTSPADREVVRMLRGEYGDWSFVKEQLGGRAIACLVGHPRVFLSGKKAIKIEVRRAYPRLEVIAVGEAAEMAVTLGKRLVPPTVALATLSASRAGVAAWLDEDEHICWIAEQDDRLLKVLGALSDRSNRFPASAVPALLERVPALSQQVGAQVDRRLVRDSVAPTVDPVLRLVVGRDGVLDAQLRARLTNSIPPVVPAEGPTTVWVPVEDRIQCLVRDLKAEEEGARALCAGLGLPVAPGFQWHIDRLEDSLSLVDAASTLPGLTIEWADGDPLRIHVAEGDDLRIAVSKKRDWFGLDGALDIDGKTVPLAALLGAIRDRQRFLKLGEGEWVRLSDALARRLAPAAQLARQSGDEILLSPLASPSLELLANEGVTLDIPQPLAVSMQAIRAAAVLEPTPPEGLIAELRPYQVEGFCWLARLAEWAPGACLADDMGLGKTVQALALLLRRKDKGPTLVVAPTSVGFNWIREASVFAPSLATRTFRGKSELASLDGLKPGEILVTSYDLVALHRERFEAIEWGTVVLDEAQAIKNPATRRARACRALNAGFTLALSGTPVENRTSELWSLFTTVAPGLLGSAEHFRARFAGPIERNADETARKALAEVIRPFILRRLKSEVASDLPPRTDVRIDIELSEPERRLYDRLRLSTIEALNLPGPEDRADKSRMRVLAAMLRLRQLACHPRLVDPESEVASSKHHVLMDLVERAVEGGHQILVFSQFTSHLDLVATELERAGIRFHRLQGNTPTRARRTRVDAFQRGEFDVFLLSLKAAGTGLNLTAAEYVVHLDPWWNPAIEDQATDRAHRIGQDKPVTVYRLVSTDTIEETIMELHGEKRALMNDLLAGTGKATTLSPEQLMDLISRGV